MLYPYVYILGHHNGIVNHKAHREHHGKHSEHVYRESRHVHHKESANERHGNNNTGYERYAPVAQEEEDNDDYKHECFVNGALSGASGVLALAHAFDSGIITHGQLVLYPAFGSGLTWGAALIRV